jgi:hypothetical protein
MVILVAIAIMVIIVIMAIQFIVVIWDFGVISVNMVIMGICG